MTTDDREQQAKARPKRVDDVYVGRDYGRHDMVITPELVADVLRLRRRPQPDLHRRIAVRWAVAPALVRHSEVYAYRAHPKAAAPAWYLPNALRQPARAPGVGAVRPGDGRRRRCTRARSSPTAT